VVWTDRFLCYDFENHPLDPVRLELTMTLARKLGVLDRVGVVIREPSPADDSALQLVHTPDYIAAVKTAQIIRSFLAMVLARQIIQSSLVCMKLPP
jgi:acetoin utilization protein AcuC